MLAVKRIILAAAVSAIAVAAYAAGPSPPVNVDMGCTLVGQVVAYNGTSLVCAAPQRPAATVATLPTCNAGTKGAMYLVTDALAPVALAVPAGGGAVPVGVTCNGTGYIIQ